ncbi:cation:proton antiporter [Streptomyces sp. NPDC006655]|uniref:cation:proton antiporter domain-containing protein n=1 Tax=Streptomyces sp. NPDC006655 TaxID=3156898 RepID=UPI0034549CDC
MQLPDAVGRPGVSLVGVTGAEMNFALVRRRGLTAAKASVAGLLLRDIGPLILAAGVVDDVAGWFLLSVVSAMPTVGLTAGVMATSILYPVGVVLFAAVIGRPLVRAVLRWTDRSESAVPTVAAAVALVLFSPAATQVTGPEAIFGGFVCGAVIATSGVVDPAKPEPLRIAVLAVPALIFFSHRRPVHGPQVSGSASLGRGRRGADCGRRRQVRRRVHRRPEHQTYAIVDSRPRWGPGPRTGCGSDL